jgi:hypothetical protein
MRDFVIRKNHEIIGWKIINNFDVEPCIGWNNSHYYCLEKTKNSEYIINKKKLDNPNNIFKTKTDLLEKLLKNWIEIQDIFIPFSFISFTIDNSHQNFYFNYDKSLDLQYENYERLDKNKIYAVNKTTKKIEIKDKHNIDESNFLSVTNNLITSIHSALNYIFKNNGANITFIIFYKPFFLFYDEK